MTPEPAAHRWRHCSSAEGVTDAASPYHVSDPGLRDVEPALASRGVRVVRQGVRFPSGLPRASSTGRACPLPTARATAARRNVSTCPELGTGPVNV